MAEGVLSAVHLITGQVENVFLIQAYLHENKPIEEELEGLCEDEWVVFTDLLGGSITNQVLRYAAEKGILDNIHIVAGFNLALLIEVLLSDTDTPLVEVVEQAVNRAKDQLVYVNKVVQ